MLKDKHGREINYVRIAVTDKCNLRCFYCMPEEGIKFVKNNELLSYEEITRLVKILADEGVNKVRITGGEPFLRKEIMTLFQQLSDVRGISKIAVTTNGTHLDDKIDDLVSMGVRSFNLSIDSLDRQRFFEITRRDCFDEVWDSYQKLLAKKVSLKLNAVVMENRNIQDIIPMVELGRKDKVDVRFIEEMPFNGNGSFDQKLAWDHTRILEHITEEYGEIMKLSDPFGSTSFNYKVEGFSGSFGIIPAFSRSFCGSCNRLRITPKGVIKTCLYDGGIFNVRDLMRAGATDQEVLVAIKEAVAGKSKNGFEAEAKRNKLQADHVESMATIGG